MPSISSLVNTFPVGLCGLLRISARTRGLDAATLRASQSITHSALPVISVSPEEEVGLMGTQTGVPPAMRIWPR